jgi:hypothetical protein
MDRGFETPRKEVRKMAICDVRPARRLPKPKQERRSPGNLPNHEGEVLELVKAALAIEGSVNAETKQCLKQWAEETVHYIWSVSRDQDRPLTPRATNLLKTLAIQVAQFRLTSISGNHDGADARAKLITELADKIVVDNAVPLSVVDKIIASGAQHIKDPYKDPDVWYVPHKTPRQIPKPRR